MNTFQAVILGLLQGFSEFLPISSSGHLVLFQRILGVQEPAMTFDILLHVGTLIPVFVVFWSDIVAIIKKPFQKLTLMLIIATIPTVIVGLLFKDTIEKQFAPDGSLVFFPYCFILTGFFLLYADRMTNTTKKEEDMTAIDALVIGIMQAIAITPAISRSGSTISGALFRKLDREYAARFAFLMSIPAVIGATILQAKDIVTGAVPMDSILTMPHILGVLVAALSGYLAIKFMLNVVKQCKLRYFAYYVFAVGALILVDRYMTHFYF